ncbi:TPA: dihydropteroate synthase [Salmonella enterica subsp. enterica serovar Typhimurium]
MKLFAQGATLDLTHPHVMGILNVTPDSFSDGGAHNTLIEAVKHANLMVNAGATIIDVGGESTRPGAAEVSVEEELDRVIPVLEAIAQRFEVWISVDTSKPEVIREAARAGRILSMMSVHSPNPARWKRQRKPACRSVLCTCRATPKPCRRRRNMTMSLPR